jgi:hypothetical protein
MDQAEDKNSNKSKRVFNADLFFHIPASYKQNQAHKNCGFEEINLKQLSKLRIDS